ncbi:MarR family transcriptional regulator [Sphingomonas sp. J344]|uniref:MarR family winged helix-turn-helix transcriptional regulator n=1 Tax=Sphingomonas sp. J344 TaxID=2898434 RepID=UPI002151BD3F|nr:MarR family transcriptional regulator [Sphingomonas sp. J344]MCR5869767.1 MarR family transcriptional regulator [Sphingomonas sp. J344]
MSNHVSAAFARKVEARGVTVAEWVVLRALADDPATRPARLAERLALTPGAVSKLGDRLEAKKLVVRTPLPDDRRAHHLALTDAGAALVPELASLADANESEWFGELTPDDRAALDRILRQLAEQHGLRAAPLD